MKIKISKQWRNYAPLGRSSFTSSENSIFMNPCLQKAFDITQDAFICDTMSQKIHQLVLIYVVKEASNIGLYNVFRTFLFYGLVQCPQCIMASSIRAKTVRVFYEILLIDGL